MMMYYAIGLVATVLVAIIFFSVKRKQAQSNAPVNRRLRQTPPKVMPRFEASNVDADKILGLDDEPAPVVKKVITEPQYIAFNIMANEGVFAGYELLQALLTNGLRFGKQQIFHRHTEPNAQGEILFSLASVAKPGTFDLQKMGSFETPGLTMFIVLNDLKDPLAAFDLMIETAYAVAEDLNGSIFTQQHEAVDKLIISKWRKQVKNLIEGQTVGDLFAVEVAE